MYDGHRRVQLLQDRDRLREGDRLHIVDERVQSATRRAPLFAVVEPSVGLAGDIAVAYDNFKRGGNKPRMACTDQQTVLAQVRSPARFQRTHQKALQTVPRIARQYEILLRNVPLVDPRPRQMRGYSFRNETRLNEHGSNLQRDASKLDARLYVPTSAREAGSG